jgi:hypothetical protein
LHDNTSAGAVNTGKQARASSKRVSTFFSGAGDLFDKKKKKKDDKIKRDLSSSPITQPSNATPLNTPISPRQPSFTPGQPLTTSGSAIAPLRSSNARSVMLTSELNEVLQSRPSSARFTTNPTRGFSSRPMPPSPVAPPPHAVAPPPHHPAAPPPHHTAAPPPHHAAAPLPQLPKMPPPNSPHQVPVSSNPVPSLPSPITRSTTSVTPTSSNSPRVITNPSTPGLIEIFSWNIYFSQLIILFFISTIK